MTQEFKLFKVTVTDSVGSSTTMEVRALKSHIACWFVRDLFQSRNGKFLFTSEEIVKSADLFLE